MNPQQDPTPPHGWADQQFPVPGQPPAMADQVRAAADRWGRNLSGVSPQEWAAIAANLTGKAEQGQAPATPAPARKPAELIRSAAAGCFLVLLLPLAVVGLWWWPAGFLAYAVSLGMLWTAKGAGWWFGFLGAVVMMVSTYGTVAFLSRIVLPGNPWTWHG